MVGRSNQGITSDWGRWLGWTLTDQFHTGAWMFSLAMTTHAARTSHVAHNLALVRHAFRPDPVEHGQNQHQDQAIAGCDLGRVQSYPTGLAVDRDRTDDEEDED